MNREEYVAKLKQQLDQWNAEAAKWETKAKAAQAGMKTDYESQLAQVRAKRDEAMYQMKLLQNASADAWMDLMKGADQAWKSMGEALARARTKFEK